MRRVLGTGAWSHLSDGTGRRPTIVPSRSLALVNRGANGLKVIEVRRREYALLKSRARRDRNERSCSLMEDCDE